MVGVLSVASCGEEEVVWLCVYVCSKNGSQHTTLPASTRPTARQRLEKNKRV